MARLVVKGWYYDPEAEPERRFTKGWALLDGPRLVEAGRTSRPPAGPSTVNGIALPALPNAHTHLADNHLRKHVKPGMTVQELVAPPDGLKHRFLPKLDVVESISDALKEMAREGVGRFCDFREGGLAGVEALARALVSGGKGLKATIMGRPKGLSYDRKELDALLAKCDGIGLSALRDWDPSELAKVATHARGSGKSFALHASEVVREPIDDVLDLNPDFVVHMVKGNKSDFHRLSVLCIPVVVCPRSNLYYGIRPPIKDMLDAGVMVCIGSDNAMLNGPSVLDELGAARRLGLSAIEAWSLIEESWKLLNRKDNIRQHDPSARWIVLEAVTDGPLEALTGASPPPAVRVR